MGVVTDIQVWGARAHHIQPGAMKGKMTPIENLRALGASSNKVAAKLESFGIKGYNTRGDNPIAEYLNLTNPREDRWAVDGGVAYVPFGYEEVELPRYVLVFDRRFSEGRYPSLEMKEE
jgi:hypothetical protein